MKTTNINLADAGDQAGWAALERANRLNAITQAAARGLLDVGDLLNGTEATHDQIERLRGRASRALREPTPEERFRAMEREES